MMKLFGIGKLVVIVAIINRLSWFLPTPRFRLIIFYHYNLLASRFRFRTPATYELAIPASIATFARLFLLSLRRSHLFVYMHAHWQAAHTHSYPIIFLSHRSPRSLL